MKSPINTRMFLEKAEKIAGVGHWHYNIETQDLFWSEQVYNIHGLNPKKYKPTVDEAVSFYHPDDREYVRSMVETCIETSKPYEFNLRLIRRDGELRYVRSLGETEKDDHGKVIAIFGVFQDVTESKLREIEIVEKEKFLETMMNTLPDAVFVKDEKFRIVRANDVFLNMYPQDKRDKVIGYTTLEDYDAKSVEKFLEFDKLAFKEGFSETEETLCFPDGITRTLLTKKARFQNVQGHQFILGVATDVTILKDAEKSVLQANKELSQSNADLEDFAYITSHDLKEPLRGIYNYSQFVLEDCADKLNEEDVDKLNTIVRLSKRMESLMDALLEYSRVGRTELAMQDTDINEVIREIIDDLSFQVKQKNVKMTVQKDLPNVICDRVRVGEVFRNLITNAIKYNDQDVKTIEIGCDRAHPKHLDKCVFFVKDNGIGIEPQHVDKIFKIFKRLHGRNDYDGGTGSGLTIIKKIIKRHDGEMWVESKHGKGSTFYFTLEC